MAEMLASIALMIAAIRIGKPLISNVIGMSVMSLVEAVFIHRLGCTLHTYEEQCHDENLENHCAHFGSLHKNDSHVQIPFT